MGRRVTSSTKGGRYMNPADQERKVTRRKELKKNKKQRQLVRQAVLKSKDPKQLIDEMEKLDRMEFDPHAEPPISERVIQEKRSKLRETFVRVLTMYKRESEEEKYAEMKKTLQEYDRRKSQMEQHYIAVKFAREVDPGEIPLPDSAPPLLQSATGQIMMPPFGHMNQPGPFPPHLMMPFGPGTANAAIPPHMFGKLPAHGILKKRQRPMIPPGVPIGPAPELSDEDEEQDYRRTMGHEMEDVDSEEGELDDEAGTSEVGKSSRVRFNEADSDDDEKDSRTKYKQLAKRIAVGEKAPEAGDNPLLPAAATNPNNPAYGMAPAPIRSMMRPMGPILPPRMGPPMPQLGFPPRLQPGMRMLPPPPAFLRGAGFQRMFIGPAQPTSSSDSSTIASGPVLSAPPTVNKLAKASAGPTIEAKPQLRNMQHEITKFVPTGVKIKQERGTTASSTSTTTSNKPKGHIVFRVAASSTAQANQRAKTKTTDDAYDEFMNEMKDLM